MSGEQLKKKVISAAIFLVVIILLMFSSRGRYSVKFENETVVINASYWKDMTIPYAEIENVEYREEVSLGNRTHGYGTPFITMGKCENEEFGNYIAYVYESCVPCIVITTNSGTVVINRDAEEQTKELYEQLIQIVEK